MVRRLRTFGGLSMEPGSASGGLLLNRRPLALLAVLAVKGRRGLSRDGIITLLWPESDGERGRNSLNHLLSGLRREFGADDVIVGTNDLRLNPEIVVCDAVEFDDRTAAGDLEGATHLYAGPFLDGVFLKNAPDFEHWVDHERSRLHHAQSDALERLATRASAAGDHGQAIRFARQRAALAPNDSRAARHLMETLAAAGDPAGALAHYRSHAALVRDDLGVEPDAMLAEFAATLRGRNSHTSSAANGAALQTQPVTAVLDDTVGDAGVAPLVLPSSMPRRLSFVMATITLIVMAATAFWGTKIGRFSSRPEKPPAHDSLRLRIVTASAQSDPADSALAVRVRNSALAEMERDPWLFVVTPQAWLQLQPHIGLDPALLALPDTIRKYARKVVTHAIVDFGVSRAGNGYILTAEARGASTDSSLGVIAVAAAGALDLPNAMTRLGRALRDSLVAARYALPPTRWSANTTNEPATAITLYVEARSEIERGNYIEAARRAERATQVDSTFAMAWRTRHLSLSNANLSVDEQLRAISAAFRYSDRVRSPWARLDIIAAYYRAVGDHARALVFYDTIARITSDQNVNMGLSLAMLRKYDLAARVYRRAIETRQIKRPSAQHGNLVWQLLSDGKLAEATEVLDWMVRTDATHFQTVRARGHFFKATRDWESLAALGKASISTGWPKTATDTAVVMELVGLGAIGRGHIATFDSAVQAGATIVQQNGSSGTALARQLERARLHATMASDTARARTIADSAVAAANWNAMRQMDRPYPALLLYLASVGDVRHGGEVLRDWSSRTPVEYKLRDSLNVLIARGELELASGNPREALRLFRIADVRGCEPCFHPRYARAFDAMRQPDSARVWFERYANAVIPTNTIDDMLELPHTYRRLGDLYEARGDVSAAIAWYDRFTMLWATSDSPVPRAAVRAVRAHVDELRTQRPMGRATPNVTAAGPSGSGHPR